MKPKLFIILSLLTAFVVVWGLSFADSDGDDDKNMRLWSRTTGVSPNNNILYQQECGSCHFAYQAGLLPEQSWRAIMTQLDEHFDENAELDPQEHKEILNYLTNNSADKSNARRSRHIMRSLSPNQAPLRITNIPYIKKEHREIPARLITGNPKVSSLSNCDNCHQNAAQGSFSENAIKIPGYGKWDD
ncbi:MAG: hypothetical protein GXP08_03835 [Gammaproteobacteria bacterium]|nr:hypothetical protein [Gammaproteobacteria bacterium]